MLFSRSASKYFFFVVQNFHGKVLRDFPKITWPNAKPGIVTYRTVKTNKAKEKTHMDGGNIVLISQRKVESCNNLFSRQSREPQSSMPCNNNFMNLLFHNYFCKVAIRRVNFSFNFYSLVVLYNCSCIISQVHILCSQLAYILVPFSSLFPLLTTLVNFFNPWIPL